MHLWMWPALFPRSSMGLLQYLCQKHQLQRTLQVSCRANCMTHCQISGNDASNSNPNQGSFVGLGAHGIE